MRSEMSYALTAQQGKHLVRKVDGKDVGAYIWCAAGILPAAFDNVGNIEERPMLFADEGKELVHGDVRCKAVWDKGEGWVEEDELPPEEPVMEEALPE